MAESAMTVWEVAACVRGNEAPLEGACEEAGRRGSRAQVVALAGVREIGGFPERLV